MYELGMGIFDRGSRDRENPLVAARYRSREPSDHSGRGGRPMKLLLTGGCGFIGSAVVRHVLRHTDHLVVNIDKLTYAASEDALEEAARHHRHILVRADIADGLTMRQVFATHQPD